MLLGISGAWRREELYKMTIQDTDDQATLTVVKFSKQK